MNEPTPIQLLEHLFQLALEASVPAKVHQQSQKAFEVLKKVIDPSQPINDIHGNIHVVEKG